MVVQARMLRQWWFVAGMLGWQPMDSLLNVA